MIEMENVLSILRSEADKTGRDIALMSDFMGDGLRILAGRNAKKSSSLAVELPVTAFGAIHDVLSIGEAIIGAEYSWIPDFDSLPKDIRQKLDKGIYTIGESRQVEGNHRAVILDENDVRIKDVTLKQIKNEPSCDMAYRDLLTQIKLQQISSTLEDIAEMQAYQIQRDRDADITVPFLNARDLILEAENEDDPQRRKELLKRAREGFGGVTNSLCVYLNRDIGLLADRSSRQLPLVDKRVTLFLRPKKIREAMGFVLEDLQTLQKTVGLQVQISNVLDDDNMANRTLTQYNDVLLKFCEKPLDSTGRSAAQLMHAYFPYSEGNMDMWRTLRTDILETNNTRKNLADGGTIYLIELEDVDDDDSASE